MWPFRKHTDPVELRLSGHSSDILVLYDKCRRLESKIMVLDKRIADLENLLKSSKIRITIVEKQL